MEFKREDCTFTIPDRPTVRQQLQYFAAASSSDRNEVMIRFWEGAKQLIQTWTCEKLPDYKTSLDEMTAPSQADLVMWAGFQVKLYMDKLEDVPKN